MKQFKPHGYQTKLINWILDKPKVGIFAGMGLGKTVTTLTALDDLMYNSFDIGKVLVIAPKLVAESTWTDEITKWCHLRHLRINVISGDKVSPAERIRRVSETADIHVIGRDNVDWLVSHLKTKWDYDTVVIDELSSFKSPSSKRFKSLRKVIRFSSRVIGLTGTPAPNGLLDLWSQIYLLDGGQRLGRTFEMYRDIYFTPASYIRDSSGRSHASNYVPRAGSEAKIWALISDICISMKAEDYLDMPPAIHNPISVKLSPKAMSLYNKLEQDLLLRLEDSDIVADNAAALTNKLLQAANGAVYDENREPKTIHSDMIAALRERLDVADSNVMLFYNFKHDLTAILEAFPDAVKLETSDQQKEWNDKKIKLLVAHPASAGHGLNLQFGGHNVIWYGLPWNLEWFQQANKRLDRQGQERRVTISYLIPKDTLVEAVYERLQNKAATQDGLLEALSERKKKIALL